MDIQKVDMYLITNQKFFPADKIPFIRAKLLEMDESRFMALSAVSMNDPTLILVISIVVGTLGIDRFMIGDIGMGVLKLLTAGLCGILAIIDWFLIMDRTRESNFLKLMPFVG